jgi:hypothetical protein
MSTKAAKPARFLTKAEQEELAKKARARRRARALADSQRREAELRDDQEKARREQEQAQWTSYLEALQVAAPRLRHNPWLLIQDTQFTHQYLDSLTDVLAGFRDHTDDFQRVRAVLSEVYESFVGLARFARVQPGFYITDPRTIGRFVRLLEHVAHKGSDKSLFPNVLHLLTPTLERPHLHPLLADAGLISPLMRWVPEWMPTPETLHLLLQVFRTLSASQVMRDRFLQEPYFETLQLLSLGHKEGFSPQQQAAAQAALRAYPPPPEPDAAPPAAEAEADAPAPE